MDLIAGMGKLINPGTIKRYRLVSIGFRILTPRITMSRIHFLHFIQPSFLWNEVINLSLPTLGIVKCQGFCIDLTGFLVTVIIRGKRKNYFFYFSIFVYFYVLILIFCINIRIFVITIIF